MIATLEYSFGKAMLAAVDEYFDQMGVDGLYWDEMETTGYGSPLVSHLFGDGYSCAIDDRHEVDHQVAVQSIAGAGHRVAVVERVYERGRMVMGNGPTFTRRSLELRSRAWWRSSTTTSGGMRGCWTLHSATSRATSPRDRFVRVINQASLPVATHWSL